MKNFRTTEFFRSADIASESFDANERTIEVVFSTGARVLRRPFLEESFIEVRLDRLNNGAPLLNNHCSRELADILGVIEHKMYDGAKCAGAGDARLGMRLQ